MNEENEETTQMSRCEQHVNDSSTAARTGRRLSRRSVLTVAAGAGVSSAISGAVTAQQDQDENQDTQTATVELTADETDIGETIEATVSISEVPRGLSGLLGEVGVADPEVATIVGASIDEDFGMDQDPEFSDDGSTCELVAADINGEFSEGDTDLELFTLELEGQDHGETELVFDELIEAGDGTFYDVDLEGDQFTVGDGPESGGDGGSSQMPGFGVGGAVAGIVGGLAYLLRGRASRE
ncbi:hypothetical protein [Halomontanus rarus]|uniref:hypothetical protein n=1 Tax=Halomontanus rarus TaxID=3034020 RepID=UPI0023E7CC44|nr:hypothetical protein [Halovivax sp. TS33]